MYAVNFNINSHPFQQCVGTFGEPLFEYKKSIETKFNEIKTACFTDSSGSPSTCRLPSHLSQWYVRIIITL